MDGKDAESAGGKLVLNVDAGAQASQIESACSAKYSIPLDDPDCVLAVAPEGEQGPAGQGISFDDALTKYVGDFGRGQRALYFYACLLQIPNAVLILLLVFSTGSPVADKAWACTQSAEIDPQCAAILANPDVAAVKDGFCSLSAHQWHWTSPGLDLVSRFNLICADEWKRQLANSFFFVGYLIGSGVCGVVADAYGRKAITFGATALGAVFTAAALGATNYWVLMILRLLTGIGVAGQALGSFLLATEMIGPSLRGVAGIITQVFFIVGEFALVVIGVAFTSWRGQFAAAAVFCAVTLVLWPVIPESGRWLYVKGQTEQAMQVLGKIAQQNRTRPPAEPLAPIHNSEAGSKDTGNKLSILTALKNFHISRRFFILAYTWLVMCMVYYGISFAVGSLGSSLVMSFSIAAIAELPAYLLAAWAIEHCGRHNTMAGGLLLGGAACLGCAFAPAGTGKSVLAAVGKFGISASFGTASVYTSELFPTIIRSAVLGYQNQAARVGGIVAPFIVMAGSASGSGGASAVPFLVFGAAAILSGLLVFTLPETLGVPLPDTLQDMDNIASVFTHKTWKTGGIKAATKSMFKARVYLKKPTTTPGAAAKRAGALAPVPEGMAASAVSAKGMCSQQAAKSMLGASNSRVALLTSEDSAAVAAGQPMEPVKSHEAV